MLTALHNNKRVQLLLGLLIGIGFGFFLHKGGVTKYDVIVGQLLMSDLTVLRVMLSAVVVGMIGVYALKAMGLAELHAPTGSVGSIVIGGLMFGAGFALLGFCPGTLAGAIPNGALDALAGGLPGLLVGAMLFAALYPRLDKRILHLGPLGGPTFPELLKVNEWLVIVPLCAALVGLLAVLEWAGL
jgi:hypothetical protein